MGARNVEVKAKARDFQHQCATARQLAGRDGEVLLQEDTFFAVPRGRLKLRVFGDGGGELIQYQRPDHLGPKACDYVRTSIAEPLALKEALANALGVTAVVRKRRTVFLVGQTRIHFDQVAGLGEHIELEVVLTAEQTAAQGSAVARELMKQLAIEPVDLIAGAYVDLLTQE
ncbi:MAG: class IV adenylate cyclase [Candidatus Competibacterales bacterium]